MLLALSTGLSGPQHQDNAGGGGIGVTNTGMVTPGSGGRQSTRKRFRTKFSQDQKERMHQFAERVGWKMQKRDEEIVQEFCNEIGVEKGTLKVWMHNNKNTFGKKDVNGTGSTGRNVVEQIHNNGSNNDKNENTNNNSENNDDDDDNNNNSQSPNHNYQDDHGVAHVATNGSSSSS